MPVRLSGTTSGYTELSAPAVAGNNTLTLPTGNGTARQLMMTDGAGTLSFVNDAGALYYRLNADLAGANVTTAQNIFGVGVTLAANTVYAFEGAYLLTKTAGTTSHTVSQSFGGSATVNNIGGYVDAQWSSTSFTAPAIGGSNFLRCGITSTGTINPIGASISAAVYFTFATKGTVSINAGGTFIPQYTLSAAPGGAYSTVAGSYIRFVPIGTAGSNSSQGTWS